MRRANADSNAVWAGVECPPIEAGTGPPVGLPRPRGQPVG